MTGADLEGGGRRDLQVVGEPGELATNFLDVVLLDLIPVAHHDAAAEAGHLVHQGDEDAVDAAGFTGAATAASADDEGSGVFDQVVELTLLGLQRDEGD